MLFGKKKNHETPDFSWIHTDMHSHMIPAIDDGAQDIQGSLDMIKGLASLGYKKIITTPHVLWEMYPNTPEKINAGLDTVKSALKESSIDIAFHAAAEYYIDDHFDRYLRSKAPLLTLSGNIVLVEFSMITAPHQLPSIIFEMEIQNYQPVIAHPERYVYLARNKEFYEDLKSSGCYFQLNLLSIAGVYGQPVQELAEYLLKKNYYNYVGTDMHNARHLELLQKVPASALKRLRDSGAIKNHLL
ncbi:MAG: CpsB/CapC family capsule biosynthesis tyrosine phosphatase [Flavisolibacter sp.]